jgi:hypothetical protein
MVQVPRLLESIDIQFPNDERLNSLMESVKKLSKQLQNEEIESVISGLAQGNNSLKEEIEKAIVTCGQYAVPEFLAATMLAEKYRPENAEVAAMYTSIALEVVRNYNIMQISKNIADCSSPPFRDLSL